MSSRLRLLWLEGQVMIVASRGKKTEKTFLQDIKMRKSRLLLLDLLL